MTAHLDKVEGAVFVLPDEPHDVSAIAQNKSPAIVGKVARDVVGPAFDIGGTAVVVVREELTLSRCLPTGAPSRRGLATGLAVGYAWRTVGRQRADGPVDGWARSVMGHAAIMMRRSYRTSNQGRFEAG